MSVRIITWAFDQKTNSAMLKLILVKLADNANDDGMCFPSLAYLKRHCELSRNTLIAGIRKLESLGLISVEKRRLEGVNLSNVYHLLIGDPGISGVVVQPLHHGGSAIRTGGVVQPLHPNPKIEPSSSHTPAKQSSEEPTLALDSRETRQNSPAGEPGASLAPAQPQPAQGALDAEFAQFWAIYPKRASKGAALKAFKPARKIATMEQILNGVGRYVDKPGRTLQYTKHPATWLNSQCWADEDGAQDGGHYAVGETDYQRRHREWRDGGRVGPQPQPHDKAG